MGDDFDLFPKRENLDPFSFGKKDKPSKKEQAEGTDELFGQPDQDSEQLPEFTIDEPSDPEVGLEADPKPLPDLPLDSMDAPPHTPPGIPPAETPPGQDATGPGTSPDIMEGILAEGPISEEKTFDEPVLEGAPARIHDNEKPRKSPSPFLIVGGALIIIIGLLYGALTYLKRDKAQVPRMSQPEVSVPVTPAQPEPEPEPQTAAPESAVPDAPPASVEEVLPEGTEVVSPEPAAEEVPESAAATAPEPAPVREQAPTATEPPPATASAGTQYSIQVGAFILDSSVVELEKKIRELGYDPILKEGSTTAMMNMLTVGPFKDTRDAGAALSRLRDAGVDSNMRRRNDGTAIINAGSYLLEENATSVMKKVRSLGYPVRLSKNEANLPMTFVRVGQYRDLEEANTAMDELKVKGLEGIVVKLQ